MLMGAALFLLAGILFSWVFLRIGYGLGLRFGLGMHGTAGAASGA